MEKRVKHKRKRVGKGQIDATVLLVVGDALVTFLWALLSSTFAEVSLVAVYAGYYAAFLALLICLSLVAHTQSQLLANCQDLVVQYPC
jgi:hypothetical protein